MVGWAIVAASAVACGAVIRWYRKAGGVSAYTGADRERIDSLRARHSHDGRGGRS
jgi:hypothetical protein